MFGFRRRTLVLGNEGIVLFGPSPRGGVERELSLAWSIPNFEEQLIDVLSSRHSKNSVTILFDSTDNAFRREENIPKLNALDRKKYVKRKLDQVFSTYPIRAFMEMKDKDASKEKKRPSYLFYAITEIENINIIIKCILEAAVPVAGFGVLPIESEEMVATLATKLFDTKENKGKKKSKWAVLLGQNETGGLRQVVVKNGKMVLTRLTPTSEAGVQGKEWVDEVITEFTATQTYLTRLGYRPDDGLDVIVIASKKDDFYFSGKEFSPGDNFACLTTVDALKTIGSKRSIIDDINYGDPLYAAWSSKRKTLTFPLKIPALMNILLPRLAARIVAVLLVIAVLATAGYNFHIFQEYLKVVEKVEQNERQKKLLGKEYDKESKVFEAFPIELTKVKNTLAVTDDLDSKMFKITPMLNIIKKGLPNDIKLYELIVDFTPKRTIKSRKKGRNSRRAAAAAAASSAPASSSGGTVRIEFKYALLKNMVLEKKVIRAEQIIEELKRTFKDYQIDLTQQFGNVEREGGFSGGNTDSAEKMQSVVSNEDLASVRMMGPAP